MSQERGRGKVESGVMGGNVKLPSPLLPVYGRVNFLARRNSATSFLAAA